MVRLAFAALAGVVAAFVLACGDGGDDAAPKPATPAAVEKAAPPGAGPAAAQAAADEIFSTRCATCHGMGGAGDGPGSTGLNPPPRDFRDPAWQASVSDAHLKQIIQYGGAAVGLSPAMPSNPDLIAKPDVVSALVAHVRSLKGS
jgi:mono/diheme cytochrome c family protein